MWASKESGQTVFPVMTFSIVQAEEPNETTCCCSPTVSCETKPLLVKKLKEMRNCGV